MSLDLNDLSLINKWSVWLIYWKILSVFTYIHIHTCSCLGLISVFPQQTMTVLQKIKTIWHNIDLNLLWYQSLPHHVIRSMPMRTKHVGMNSRLVLFRSAWISIITWYDGFLPPVRCISAPSTTLFGPVVCLHCFNFVNIPPPKSAWN